MYQFLKPGSLDVEMRRYRDSEAVCNVEEVGSCHVARGAALRNKLGGALTRGHFPDQTAFGISLRHPR